MASWLQQLFEKHDFSRTDVKTSLDYWLAHGYTVRPAGDNFYFRSSWDYFLQRWLFYFIPLITKNKMRTFYPNITQYENNITKITVNVLGTASYIFFALMLISFGLLISESLETVGFRKVSLASS